MTTATEVLGPALEEGLLMPKSGYDAPSAVGADDLQALRAIHSYHWNPRLASPSLSGGSSAYQLNWDLPQVTLQMPVSMLRVGNRLPLRRIGSADQFSLS